MLQYSPEMQSQALLPSVTPPSRLDSQVIILISSFIMSRKQVFGYCGSKCSKSLEMWRWTSMKQDPCGWKLFERSQLNLKPSSFNSVNHCTTCSNIVQYSFFSIILLHSFCPCTFNKVLMYTGMILNEWLSQWFCNSFKMYLSSLLVHSGDNEKVQDCSPFQSIRSVFGPSPVELIGFNPVYVCTSTCKALQRRCVSRQYGRIQCRADRKSSTESTT